MKYIVVSAIKTSNVPGGDTSVMRFPFIFPNMLVHSHIAKVATLLLSLMYPTWEIKATSAGEINSMDIEGECYGESSTLNLKAHADDTQLVRMNDYGSSVAGV